MGRRLKTDMPQPQKAFTPAAFVWISQKGQGMEEETEI